MRPSYLFAGIPTADLGAATAWYEKLLGRPPDRRPHAGEAVWQLTETGLIYVVTDAERAGNGLLTLIIDDLDTRAAELNERGLAVDPIETLPGKARTLALSDPDGNRVTIAQLAGA